MPVVYLPSACTCKSLILVDVTAPTLKEFFFVMVKESIFRSSKLCYTHPAIWTITVAWSTAPAWQGIVTWLTFDILNDLFMYSYIDSLGTVHHLSWLNHVQQNSTCLWEAMLCRVHSNNRQCILQKLLLAGDWFPRTCCVLREMLYMLFYGHGQCQIKVSSCW